MVKAIYIFLAYELCSDFWFGQIGGQVKVSDSTASAYLRILAAEGKVEISRKVGNAVFYREKKKP